MTPGYAHGGPCYPRDNKAMAQYARQSARTLGLFAGDRRTERSAHGSHGNDLMQIHKKKYIFSDVAYKPKCAVPMIDHSANRHRRALARAGRRAVIKDRVPLVHEVMKKFVVIRVHISISVTNVLRNNSSRFDVRARLELLFRHAFPSVDDHRITELSIHIIGPVDNTIGVPPSHDVS